MKKLLVTGVLCATLAGCTSEVTLSDGKAHQCVGVDGDKEAGVRYKPSVLNAVLGVVFVETIFAPLVWLVSDFQCPYALDGKSTI